MLLMFFFIVLHGFICDFILFAFSPHLSFSQDLKQIYFAFAAIENGIFKFYPEFFW